jgi:hypothetical protein
MIDDIALSSYELYQNIGEGLSDKLASQVPTTRLVLFPS